MTETDNLDDLIKKYSASLMKVYQKREPLPEETAVTTTKEKEEEESTPEEVREDPLTAEEKETTTDTADFMASVHTGGGAFPVPDAKIVIGKGSSIVAFLVTDKNGETPKITLPAFAEEDSLSAETAKTVSYYADVFADGFEEKRKLPVEASGGAEIILDVELTPLAERMN